MKVKLTVLQGRPKGKCIQLLRPGEYYFGRGAECHVRSNSDWVSRQHGVLRVLPNSATIRDLGSTNGTLINGIMVQEERRLYDGDYFKVVDGYQL